MAQSTISKYFKPQRRSASNIENAAEVKKEKAPEQPVGEAPQVVEIDDVQEVIEVDDTPEPGGIQDVSATSTSVQDKRNVSESAIAAPRSIESTIAKISSLKKRSNSAPTDVSIKKKLTPLERQIVSLQAQHPGMVLAINVGYKYKFYAEDARKVAPLLNISLIPANVPYCSVPESRIQIHLERLLANGLKVGLVDQVEDFENGGLFERKLANVYTHGTFVSEQNQFGNFVVALNVTCEKFVELLAANATTGEVLQDKFQDGAELLGLQQRLLRLGATEFVVCSESSSFDENSRIVQLIKKKVCKHPALRITTVDDSKDVLSCLEHYFTEFGFKYLLNDTSKFVSFETAECLFLNHSTLEHLDLIVNKDGTVKGTLLELLDHTRTPFGLRELRRWISRPLTNVMEIEKRLDFIEFARIPGNFENTSLLQLAKLLESCPDFEKSMTKVVNNRTTPIETYQFLRSIAYACETLKSVGNSRGKVSEVWFETVETLKEISNEINDDLINLLEQIKHPGQKSSMGEMATKFFTKKYTRFDELEKSRAKIVALEQILTDDLEVVRNVLKRPHLVYKSVLKDEYLIEVSKKQARVPQEWIKMSETKACIRYRTPVANTTVKQLRSANAQYELMCIEQFGIFNSEIAKYVSQLSQLHSNLAKLDCLLSISAASVAPQTYCRPRFVSQQIVNCKDARHPILERYRVCVANDINLRRVSEHKDNLGQSLVLTGPNMGGKSCYTRTVALVAIMAQIGCFVPCSSAILGIFSSLHTRIGSNDNILQNESTLMTELAQCRDILENCDSRSLVLLDELGRGTSTVDGISIASALLKYLVFDIRCLVLFITHFAEVCELSEDTDCVVNGHMAYQECESTDSFTRLVFLYKLVTGSSSGSYGLNAAKLCEIPDSVLSRAHEISQRQELEFEKKKEARECGRLVNLVRDALQNTEVEELKRVVGRTLSSSQ